MGGGNGGSGGIAGGGGGGGEEREEADYGMEDSTSRYRSTDLTVGMTKEKRPNQFYPIVNPQTGVEYLPGKSRVWRFSPQKMEEEIAAENIIWPGDSNPRMTRPRYKTRYSPDGENTKTVPVSTWINPTSSNSSNEDELEDGVLQLTAGLNQEGTQQLRELMGEQVLDY